MFKTKKIKCTLCLVLPQIFYSENKIMAKRVKIV